MELSISNEVSWEDFYLGSRKFQFLANASGLPIDQINFLLGQFLCLFIAYIFRVFLNPKNVSTSSRHCTALSAGLFISYFCFGKQVLLAVFLAVMCYSILVVIPVSVVHHVTLFVSMGFLSMIHIQRQIYEDGIFVIDITGPLMIMTQKVTSLAYSFHDGCMKKEKDLTPLQQKFLVRSQPTALEYFSYLLCFQSVLAGPYFMFTDYREFIEGTHYIKIQAMQKKDNNPLIDSNGNTSVIEPCTKPCIGDPSPKKAVVEKTLISIVCSLLVAFVCPLVPINHLTDAAFLSASWGYRFGYTLMATTMARPLYYTGWYLADAICNMSGFGFSGYDDLGQPTWNLVSNVRLMGVEFGSSFKTTLEAWNIGTMQWLRFLVYERATFQRTFFTYFLSSLWHGFYPGYYLTFLGGAFFTACARTVRRSIRHRVVVYGPFAQRLYDVLTTAVTRICLCYITFPFIMLRFWGSIQVYCSFWFYFHICGLVSLFLLPRVLSPLSKVDKLDKKSQ